MIVSMTGVIRKQILFMSGCGKWKWVRIYEDGEFVDLDTLAENGIIATDMKQLALQTLYANYQVLKKEKRAEMLYLYFNHSAF